MLDSGHVFIRQRFTAGADSAAFIASWRLFRAKTRNDLTTTTITLTLTTTHYSD
jgi:hypothetical protein